MDEVFVLAGRERVAQILSSLHCRAGQPTRAVRRIMIAGGGRVGLRLARQLGQQGRFNIKVLEEDSERCMQLASELPPQVLVLQ
ncbi:MAG TPA: Trk system potassium transport protein TrkA, partial [Comamonadaceae bacterium]|nr:Trk system potassium transport protein TrkA [Comamonadaceae bacterium]